MGIKKIKLSKNNIRNDLIVTSAVTRDPKIHVI